MGFMKTLVILLVFTSVPVTFAGSAEETQHEDIDYEIEYNDSVEDTQNEDIDLEKVSSYLNEELIGNAFEAAIEPYAGIYIPALPVLNVDFGDAASISLALAKLRLTGLDNFNITDFTARPPYNIISVDILLPKVSLDVGHYSSGGHILNLPFNGEGPLLLALHKLAIKLSLQVGLDMQGTCAKLGSTVFGLELPRFEVEFSNMNPGTDLGQLLNIVLSSFGQDITDYLEILLNGNLHDTIDKIVIDIINTNIPTCNWVRDNPLDDERINAYLNDILQHYLQAFKVPGRFRSA